MKALQAAVRVKDRTIIELDPRVTRQGGIKEGQVFAQELTPDGDILLKRLEASE
jgi:hypothetical protein